MARVASVRGLGSEQEDQEEHPECMETLMPESQAVSKPCMLPP